MEKAPCKYCGVVIKKGNVRYHRMDENYVHYHIKCKDKHDKDLLINNKTIKCGHCNEEIPKSGMGNIIIGNDNKVYHKDCPATEEAEEFVFDEYEKPKHKHRYEMAGGATKGILPRWVAYRRME